MSSVEGHADWRQMADRFRSRIPDQSSWYEIRNADDDDQATIRIYGEIGGLYGVTEEDFAQELDEVTAPNVEVQISSPGGSAFSGVAIYNALRNHDARITTRVDGVAASAASVVVQAGDTRQMSQHAQMMIHEAWGLVLGNAGEMRDMADLLDRQTDNIAGIYASRSGRSKDQFRQMMTDETWFTDEEAVEDGLADEILSPPVREDNDPEDRADRQPAASTPSHDGEGETVLAGEFMRYLQTTRTH